jgi:hypothetical protein
VATVRPKNQFNKSITEIQSSQKVDEFQPLAGYEARMVPCCREEMEQKLLRAESRLRPPWFRYPFFKMTSLFNTASIKVEDFLL